MQGGVHEVLRYLAMGWEVSSIAEELRLSAHMVRNQSTNLRRKLDVWFSLEDVMVAVRMGVLTADDLSDVVDSERGGEQAGLELDGAAPG